MEYRQQSLRAITLKLNVSGTAEVLDDTKLYQNGYGFVKLQVYAPKTPNTEAPLCTAFKTTVDELGRENVSGLNHNLVYVGEYMLDGQVHLLFENYLPKPFTDTVGDLKITVNYCDTAPTLDADGNTIYDTNGVPMRHATALLISNQYVTRVERGGYNSADIELNINSAEAAQINSNTTRIINLEYEASGLRNYIDDAVDEIHAAVAQVIGGGEKIDEAIAEANEMVVTASNYATNASESAALALQYAQNSGASASISHECSVESATNASKAESAAERAAESAQVAQGCVNTAQGMLDDLDDALREAAHNLIIETEEDLNRIVSDTDAQLEVLKASAQESKDLADSAKLAAQGSAQYAADTEKSAKSVLVDLAMLRAEYDNAMSALQTALTYIQELEQHIADQRCTGVYKDGVGLATLNVSATPTADAGALYDVQGNLKSNTPVHNSDCVRVADLSALLTGGAFFTPITTESGEEIVTESGDALQINFSL